MDYDMSTVALYRKRGDQLSAAMKLLGDDVPGYGSAVALLAVHCAISLNDAACICYSGSRCKSENHADAVQYLKKLCGKKASEGWKHYSWLLGRKNEFSYGNKRLEKEDVDSAIDHAERFQAWLMTNFPRAFREFNS
jgi:hypothetical protein